MVKYFTLVLGSLMLLVISACASPGSNVTLTGQAWIATELDGESVLLDTTITAEFKDDGTLGGSNGCNRYNTTYTVDGDNIQINSPMASTLMACPDPVMAQEGVYMEAMEAAAKFEISGEELILFNEAGDALVTYTAGSNELAGTSWEVISYNNGKEAVVSVIIGTQITADFGEDGQLTGNGGCNSYFASYETDEDKITIGPAGMTEMACMEPEGVMEQEQLYLAALGMADVYRIEADSLQFRTAEGSTVANFQRSSAP
ncbi:MAG: META domain-containing protein [Anaerolineales bacterium]